MKNRLILISLIFLLWEFLVFIKVWFINFPSTILILLFIIFYCIVLSLSQLFLGKNNYKLIQNNLISKGIADEVSEMGNAPLCSPPEVTTAHVNIFIPAHNEALVLAETIENLVQLDYPAYDILIVNDRSKDNTEIIAKNLVEKYPDKVKLYSRSDDSVPGKSAVLNDALSITNGEIICVFDADAKVKPDFLKKILPYLAPENIDAVQARKIVSNKEYNFLTQFQSFEYCMDAYLQLGKDSLKGAVELRGNGELVKRTALVKVGAWNENTLTDDLDLSTKLHLANLNIRFCNDTMVYEEGITNIKCIINQRKRWAEGSIRRYLDYSDEIFASQNVNLRKLLDMIAYISEFVLPVWLISEMIIQLIFVLLGYQPEIFLNLLTILFIDLFFISLLFVSIRKCDHYNLPEALIWSVLTSLYIMTLWTLVVFIVVAKIILKQRDLSWYKTRHVGNIECVNQEVNERS